MDGKEWKYRGRAPDVEHPGQRTQEPELATGLESNNINNNISYTYWMLILSQTFYMHYLFILYRHPYTNTQARMLTHIFS